MPIPVLFFTLPTQEPQLMLTCHHVVFGCDFITPLVISTLQSQSHGLPSPHAALFIPSQSLLVLKEEFVEKMSEEL